MRLFKHRHLLYSRPCILGDNAFTNELTQIMDTYLTIHFKSSLKTYCVKYKGNNNVYIRCFGATRGYITVNRRNIITDIKIDVIESDIYKKEILELAEQFIGSKIIL